MGRPGTSLQLRKFSGSKRLDMMNEFLCIDSVEEFRSVGRVTDGKTDIDDDGFILVKCKEKNTRKHVTNYVAANDAAARKSEKIVSWSLP
jgi:hypothetical protein